MTTQEQMAAPVAAERNAALVGTPLLMLGVALAAANLRPAITSIGPLLNEVRTALGASELWASVLTAVPTLCFAVAAAAAPLAARKLGLARAVGAGLIVLTAGLLLRVVGGPWVVLAGTFVAASGIAIGNVLIPVVVKQAFPDRIPLLTTVYTVALMVGGGAGAAATPWLQDQLGGWRITLAAWSLLAVAALLVWVAGTRRTGRPAANPVAPQERKLLLRSPLAWLITAFFGLQAAGSYVLMGWAAAVFTGAGIGKNESGLLLGLLVAAALPVTMVVVPSAMRSRSQSWWIAGLVGLEIIGTLGMIISPMTLPWLWSLLWGAGMGVFPIALGLFAVRTRTSADTAGISAMAQGFGYLIAMGGPLLFGVLHGSTGGWTIPMIMLAVIFVVDLVLGFIVGRPRYV
ncbi:MFS transporter [Sphaerisporangium corydalis]|uniref:MFS transporter n=1 Tax=Sphaerisporangium corydalis TaxID=1441875 RepID=A0ABV9EQQ1_9ACTN|nr:MFS transporter [Sphaerisporangium corydalis]